MPSRAQDILVYRGDSRQVTIAVATQDGTPFDSTDPVLVAKWRMAATSTSSPDLIVRQSDTGGITWAPGGIATMQLASADTDLEPGVYYHELRVFDGSDVAMTMIGAFVVRRTRGLAA